MMRNKETETTNTPGILQWISSSASSAYQAWQGFTRVISSNAWFFLDEKFQNAVDYALDDYDEPDAQPEKKELTVEQEAAEEWRRGLYATVFHALPILIYHTGVRPVADAALRTVISNPYAEQLALYTLDLAALGYVIPKIAGANLQDWFVESKVNQITTAKACAKVSGKPDANHPGMRANPLMEPCEHGGPANFLASLMSVVEYLGCRTLIYGAERTLEGTVPGIKYLAFLANALLFGSDLIDSPLGQAWHCAECRNKAKKDNKAFLAGLGGGYIVTHQALLFLLTLPEHVLQRLLKPYFGESAGPGMVTGFVLDHMLRSMLTHHYKAVLNLTRQQGLPGATPGHDFLKGPRALTDFVVEGTAGWAASQLAAPSGGAVDPNINMYEDIKKQLHTYWESRSGKLIRRFLLSENLQSWKKFVARPAIQHFLKYCGPDIAGGLGWLLLQREVFKHRLASALMKWTLGDKIVDWMATADDKKTLDILMRDELEHIIKDWLPFIKAETANAIENLARNKKHGFLDNDDSSARPPVSEDDVNQLVDLCWQIANSEVSEQEDKLPEQPVPADKHEEAGFLKTKKVVDQLEVRNKKIMKLVDGMFDEVLDQAIQSKLASAATQNDVAAAADKTSAPQTEKSVGDDNLRELFDQIFLEPEEEPRIAAVAPTEKGLAAVAINDVAEPAALLAEKQPEATPAVAIRKGPSFNIFAPEPSATTKQRKQTATEDYVASIFANP